MRFRLGNSASTRSGARRSRWAKGRWAAAAGVSVAIVLALVGVALGGVFAGSGAGASTKDARLSGPAPATHSALTAQAHTLTAQAHTPAASHRLAPPLQTAPPPHHTAPRATPAPTGPARHHAHGLRTSCRYVAHIGDSTSVDLTATGGDITDPAQQLPARYADVGVKHLLLDASGGRSIVEEMPGQVNGYDVAQNWWNQGYRGCWVFALGTNDTANISAGSNVGMMARIQEMMSVAHGEPVMWVNTVTQLHSGAWSEANEQAWDNTLVSLLAKYPNMRIFNWASVAQPAWFLPDGIHYNPVGCAARAQAIADALARAFPRYGYSPGQIVR